MRRDRFALLFTLTAIVSAAGVAGAQEFAFKPYLTSRAWFVASDGIGVNGGGVIGRTGLVQLFRGAGTFRITEDKGVEFGVLRIQELDPVTKLANDPAMNIPEADGLSLGLALLGPDGPRGTIPASTVLGATLLKRPTNDPTKTRITGGIMAGFESNVMDLPVDWADLTAGLRIMLMPVGNRHQLYIVALTGGLRIG